MSGTTYRHVAIWIDHHQAVLLMFRTSPLLRPTVEGPDGQWFQYRVDARQHRRAQGYYEAVLSLLNPQDEIFILGPDQAKRELLGRIEGHQGAKGTVVGIHDAARLSEVDLVCPTGEVWRAGDGPRTAALIPKPASESPGRLGRLP
jgi:hypothetical protein